MVYNVLFHIQLSKVISSEAQYVINFWHYNQQLSFTILSSLHIYHGWPRVTVSAAETAIRSICYESQCSREIFNEADIFVDLKASTENIEQKRYSFNHL
jgi:hypothetical protein